MFHSVLLGLGFNISKRIRLILTDEGIFTYDLVGVGWCHSLLNNQIDKYIKTSLRHSLLNNQRHAT